MPPHRPTAAHLVDHVFPEAPVRQFVPTFPYPLRFLLAAEPKALTEVLAVVQRGISTFLIRRAGLTVVSGAKTGAVTLIQSFGSALNLNPHLHMLFLDGVCRYITRPPIATKRLSVDDYGRVVYRYKRPFRDGSTHVVLEPLDFIARLAALVPRPGLNLTRFHGIFAPNFKHRHQIVPRHPQRKGDDDKPLAPMNWAQRLKRGFAIDIESCPNCGGKLRVIACTRNGFASPLRTYGPCMASALACAEDPLLIRKILDHVNHGDTHSSNAARGPPGEAESLRDGIRADPIHRAVEDERGRYVRAGDRIWETRYAEDHAHYRSG